jgi:hypothetical protein
MTYLFVYYLIKNLLMRIFYKTYKEKEYNVMYFIKIFFKASYPKPCKSLSHLIPMDLTHLLNIVKSNDFVNKFIRLLQDFVCKILIFSCFCSSCGQNNFRKICFV